jgi:hypothetical protein
VLFSTSLRLLDKGLAVMNTRSVYIIVNICLVTTALLAGMPSNAKSLQTRALKGTAKSSCTGKIALPPLRQVKKTQSNFTIVFYRKDIVPCTEEEHNSNKKDENAVDLERTIPPLVSWIVAKTGWTVRKAPPVHFIPQTQLTKMLTGGEPSILSVHSLYSDEDHTIYLPDGWKPNNLLDRSALLHELAHHLQYLNHLPATCPAEYEWMAYKLQVAWLQEQGVEDPLELMGMSTLDIYILTRCPEF